MSTTSSSSSRTPTKRILTELTAFRASQPHPTIASLTPLPSNLLSLRAILSPGYTLAPSLGYTSSRFLLSITLPPTYPNVPPVITFETPCCHPNIDLKTGEICLDVLKENWSPVLGVVGALECVVRLLGEPGVDSPLNVEMGALLRGGDMVGARGLVGFWCGEYRFEGSLGAEENGGVEETR